MKWRISGSTQPPYTNNSTKNVTLPDGPWKVERDRTAPGPIPDKNSQAVDLSLSCLGEEDRQAMSQVHLAPYLLGDLAEQQLSVAHPVVSLLQLHAQFCNHVPAVLELCLCKETGLELQQHGQARQTRMPGSSAAPQFFDH